MTGPAPRTVTWWSHNKPRRMTRNADNYSEYWYGPGGDRGVFKQESRIAGALSTVVYGSALYERRTQGSTVEHTHYIQANGVTVATVRRYGTATANTTRYLHRDHLGSVVLITNESGAVTETLAYDAWGKRRPPTNWIAPGAGTFLHAQWLRRGFTAHEHIDHVGLIHMGGRVYDPEIGRFLSPDPFVQYPGSAQGMNRYAYVGNNPLSWTDPSGYFIKKFGRALRRSLGAILPIAVQFVPGMQGWGGAFVAGFVGGFLSSGNDLRAGLYGGLMASLTAGFTNGATGTPSLKAAGFRAGAGILAAHEPRLAAYVALATGSVHAHAQQGWTGVFKFGYKQYTDHVTRQYVARFAEKNGMNWFDFNLGLLAVSGFGNLEGVAGSRFNPDESMISGVNNRDPRGWLFDGVDIVLGHQGLPTASALHYASVAAGTDVLAHSLGAIDANNLASWGLTGKVSVASLPFGNVGTAGVSVFQGRGDLINGGFLSKLFTPDASLVRTKFGRHGWHSNTYSRPCSGSGTAFGVACLSSGT